MPEKRVQLNQIVKNQLPSYVQEDFPLVGEFLSQYYQGQEYAIENGIKVFDSGAQGEHKIQRGFAPVYTYSNHWLANEEFSRAVENFLKEEKSHVKEYKKQAEKLLPFKKE